MTILESNRLILRNTVDEDIATLYKNIFNDKDVVEHTFGNDLKSFEEVENFIKTSCNYYNKLGLSTLLEKQSNTIIGLAGIIKCEYLEQIDYEFGFILSKNYWGKGYAKEIGLAQIKYTKDELKAKRVLALAHKENIASLNLIKKLGLEYIKTVPTNGRGDREVYKLDF